MKKQKRKTYQIVQKEGGVTAAKGFHAGAVTAGIKDSKKPDCGLIISERPCSAAGAFTTNAVRASSVDWCEGLLPTAAVRAVFCNSGNANACTGDRGVHDTRKIAADISGLLRVKKESVLVASTGVIGHFLPMANMGKSLPKLFGNAMKASAEGGSAFAGAIMTTDTKKKECSFFVKTSAAGAFTIGGCAKGSGMIHPDMATMLAFITTDAKIPFQRLNSLVKSVVDRTFNNLTIDGDTSTNDMVLVLANGMSGLSVAPKGPAASAFEDALHAVCDTLCRKIAEDGEGATKRVEVRVQGGASFGDAKKAAKAIANSNLVKTALFGNDPNWGRILCAVGYSGARFSKEKLVLRLCGTTVFKRMRPAPFDAARVSGRMKSPVVRIDVDLGIGKECAVAHTCDLTYDYIKINAEYHT
jgi:glutamate N-acetyltransferase / amino-acid N-acetyltransferase